MGRHIKFSTAFLYKTKEVARIMEENKDIKEAKETVGRSLEIGGKRGKENEKRKVT